MPYCKQNEPWLPKLPNICHYSQRGTCSPRLLLTVVMVWLLNFTNWLGHETLLGYPRFPLTGGLNVEKDSDNSHYKIQFRVILEIIFTLSFTCQFWEFDSHIFLF